MQPIKLELSYDRTRATLSVTQTSVEFTAHDIDRLIRDLATCARE